MYKRDLYRIETLAIDTTRPFRDRKMGRPLCLCLMNEQCWEILVLIFVYKSRLYTIFAP